jgi:hypothetical protein
MRFRPELTLREAQRGTRLLWWDQVAGTPARGLERFCEKAYERKGETERLHRSPERRKALKGESQERWELKEASQG